MCYTSPYLYSTYYVLELYKASIITPTFEMKEEQG